MITDPKNTLEILLGYEIYLFSISFALVFWILDSILVQKGES
nr:UPF0715 family protein [Bacillus velezensis]